MLYADQKTRSAALLVLLLLIFSDVSRSQSGRRASKLPSPPVPGAVEAPTVNSASSTGQGQQKTHLLVARQTTRKHLQTEDAVFASFVKRLNAGVFRRHLHRRAVRPIALAQAAAANSLKINFALRLLLA